MALRKPGLTLLHFRPSATDFFGGLGGVLASSAKDDQIKAYALKMEENNFEGCKGRRVF